MRCEYLVNSSRNIFNKPDWQGLYKGLHREYFPTKQWDFSVNIGNSRITNPENFNL